MAYNTNIMYTKNNPTTAVDGKPAHCPSCGSYCDMNKDLDENDYCNDCRPQTKETALAEILEKFENGQTRYDNDPSFRLAISSLVHGVGVYAVLDGALKAGKTMQDLNAKYIQESNSTGAELLKCLEELKSLREELSKYIKDTNTTGPR